MAKGEVLEFKAAKSAVLQGAEFGLVRGGRIDLRTPFPVNCRMSQWCIKLASFRRSCATARLEVVQFMLYMTSRGYLSDDQEIAA